MLQFISSSSSLINSPLETYVRVSPGKPEISATHINFYFVTENGIKSLRVGQENEIVEILNNY